MDSLGIEPKNLGSPGSQSRTWESKPLRYGSTTFGKQ